MDAVLNEDEMLVIEPERNWTPKKLLALKGLVQWKVVAEVLNLKKHILRREVVKLQGQGKDPYQEMGARKIGPRYFVHMSRFAFYYLTYLYPPYIPLPDDIDINALLRKRGLYRLTDVCKRIPFSPEGLRYYVRRSDRPRETMGIFKDAVSGTYLVDMPKFSRWFRDFWADEECLPPEQRVSA